MQLVQYRISVDGKAIAQSDLDRIDTVTVHQRMDQPWQAQLVALICADERGFWEGEDDSLIHPFTRIRIEVSVDGETWVALIDGPVVGYDDALSPEPSQSTVTIRVSDDSLDLWRDEDTQRWSGDTDGDIARNIFQQASSIAETRIDKVAAGTSDRPSAIMQRGSLLETLQELAARHKLMHAWVAPGDSPGRSIGMFKLEDTRTSGLPPLVLLGKDRNLDTLSSNADPQRPANVTAWSLDLTDLSVSSATADYDDQVAQSDDPATNNVAELMVPPGNSYGVDPDELAQRYSAEYAEAFDARGVVRSRCYAGVLQPYKMVEVKSAGGLLSGNYVIRSVTHTLTRSEYSQEFSLLRRGQSGGADAQNPNTPTENIT